MLAVAELLTNGRLAASLRRDLAKRSESFLVLHLLDIEVASALRRLMEGRRIDWYQERAASDWTCNAPCRALCTHATVGPNLGIAAQFHRV
jgi:hypothetical protein